MHLLLLLLLFFLMLLMLIPCAEGWTELAFPVLGPCTEASAGWRRIFATSCAIASLSSSPKRSWVSTCSWDPSESDMTDEWWSTLLVLWRCQRKKLPHHSERSTFKFYSNCVLQVAMTRISVQVRTHNLRMRIHPCGARILMARPPLRCARLP